MSSEESSRLKQIAENSLYSSGVMEKAIQYCAQVFLRHLLPGPTLELGPAEGLMTDELAPLVHPFTVVEGALEFCVAIRQRHPDIEVVHSLFEEYSPQVEFQNVILGHVLEHVREPQALLLRVKDWLAPGGRVLAAVPNSHSLHRQAATLMGLLPHEAALNERDIRHGHRRVYDPYSFRGEFSSVGLDIIVHGGYWLKPLANSQIEAHWSPEMIDAFFRLGEQYPDIAGEIYVVAERERAGA